MDKNHNHNIYAPKGNPCAIAEQVITEDCWRFTILTDRLVRIEYQASKVFEDNPTQSVWNRNFPVTVFESIREDDQLIIKTEHMSIVCRAGATWKKSVKVEFSNGTCWEPGKTPDYPLGGTLRTADDCDGGWDILENKKLELSGSIFSKDGWAVLDDSESLLLNKEGMLFERKEKGLDVYLFAYKDAYKEGLQDYYALSGKPPLLPDWALGLWWSRWEEYTSEDLLAIANEFEQNDVSLSAMVIDMDWHIKKNPYTNGWTGYTWNPDFFPDPEGFFNQIHKQGIKACMNIHPADGVHPHEKPYSVMAEHMGMNPEEKKAVPFDITSPQFIEGYFKYLHHPLEKQGVDFWWIDWQQGTESDTEGLDPLWNLNHLHSQDISRNGDKRAFNFSRWSGAGAHRYPIGFIGDTLRTWRSLRYQSWFTPSSMTTGFGWWSHETGGFYCGRHDEELHIRWMQLACFSPIFRMHNNGDVTLDYRPWAFSEQTEKTLVKILKLRKQLLPLLYTLAYQNHTGGLPPLRPMYVADSGNENAFYLPTQYAFGDDLIIAPCLDPTDDSIRLARKVFRLPEGCWQDFFTGELVQGGRYDVRYCELDDIPVFAKAGSVIPLKEKSNLQLKIFSGADGSGEIYGDDGTSMHYQNGAYWRLEASHSVVDGKRIINIKQAEGDMTCPDDIEICLCGWKDIGSVRINGVDSSSKVIRKDETGVYIAIGQISQDIQIEILEDFALSAWAPKPLIEILKTFDMPNRAAQHLIWEEGKMLNDFSYLLKYSVDLSSSQLRCLCEMYAGVGYDIECIPEGGWAVRWWNHENRDGFSVNISQRRGFSDYVGKTEEKGSGYHHLTTTSTYQLWQVSANFFGACFTQENSNAQLSDQTHNAFGLTGSASI